MATYLALLRGINLGGRARVTMADLRRVFADLGHGEVRTHLQTGNVVFTARGGAARLAPAIERRIADDLGVATTVLLRTADDVARLLGGNPFVDRGLDPATLHVTFLAEAPDPAAAARITPPDSGRDEFVVAGREVLVSCPDGYGRTKLSNAFFERKLGVVATTRTWRVVTKLGELLTE